MFQWRRFSKNLLIIDFSPSPDFVLWNGAIHPFLLLSLPPFLKSHGTLSAHAPTTLPFDRVGDVACWHRLESKSKDNSFFYLS
jgi:hypothetical protein